LSNVKPESLVWLDNLAALTVELEKDPKTTHAGLAKALNLNRPYVSSLIAIKSILDPSAIEKVRQAAKGESPYLLSYNSAKVLAGLGKTKLADLPGLVHAALDVIFAQSLETRHIKALVDWIVSGKPASEFDPKYKPKKTPVEPTESQDTEDEDVPEEKPVKTQSQSSSKSKKSPASSDNPSWGETLLLDWLADISVIAQIKSKIKKRKPVSAGEWILLILHKFGEIIGHLIKLFIKLIKLLRHLFKFIWKLIVDILKEVGLYKYLKAAILIAVLVALGWFIWETHQYGIRRPMGVIESFLFKKSEEESPVQEAPTPLPVVSEPESKPKTAYVPKASQPAVVYQSSIAWQSTDEDQKLLDMEIASLPVNCIVKDFPLAPDEGIHGDMAVSRLQDLADPDKYTMKIGQDTQKILSVNATTTNLIINYKSTDPLRFLDGSGPMNRFWEDVMMIHVDEIDIQGKNPKVIYQCSLIVSGAKEPLTIQCSSPADLKHLVSTMEYFIRASRLAHDTALAGMPYPHQGVRLNNQCLVEVLWANSPMAKAGVKLGDMVWSVDNNAGLPPQREKLEVALQTLTSGSHAFYIVSPADRDAGLVQMNAAHTNAFNPKRHNVMLTSQ